MRNFEINKNIDRLIGYILAAMQCDGYEYLGQVTSWVIGSALVTFCNIMATDVRKWQSFEL